MAKPGFCLNVDSGARRGSDAAEAAFWKLRDPGSRTMDGSGVSDFSIERILSPQLRPRPQVAGDDGYLHGRPGGFSVDLGHMRPAGPVPAPAPAPAPVPVPVPCCPQYWGSFVGACYPCAAGFPRPDFQPNPGVCVHFGTKGRADAPPCRGHHGYHAPGTAGHAQQRQKARTRTVFTDAQTRQLEALFALTHYPAVEARADVARRTGLSEETVRVWFKNRRARRKRQCDSLGAPSAPVGGGAETGPLL